MVDWELTPQQCEVRDSARDFADAILHPGAARFEAQEAVPASVFRGLGQRGLMGVNVSLARGGRGAGVVAYSLAMSEVARRCASTSVAMSVTNMVGEVIECFGDEGQCLNYNARLCAGGLGAFALSEAEAGSDPGSMRTTARHEGKTWVLEGSKQWITSGDEAAVFVVWARTGGKGTRGISCFLVEGGTPGLAVARHEDKMGLRGSHTVALAFDQVRVPEAALLSTEGGGFRVAMMALDGGRIGIASQALGVAQSAYACALRASRAFASDAQGIHFRLADSKTEIEAARWLTLRAASRKEKHQAFSQEASMAKLWSTEAAWRVCNRACEIVSAANRLDCELATIEDLETVHRCLRDVRVSRIYEGTSEIQRLVIGRGALRTA